MRFKLSGCPKIISFGANHLKYKVNHIILQGGVTERPAHVPPFMKSSVYLFFAWPQFFTCTWLMVLKRIFLSNRFYLIYRYKLFSKNILGVDIKKPADTQVFKVNDAAHFYEWAEHMKKQGKDIGKLDLILICIPDRDHDETYQSIKVLTELNYGKIKCLWSLTHWCRHR